MQGPFLFYFFFLKAWELWCPFHDDKYITAPADGAPGDPYMAKAKLACCGKDGVHCGHHATFGALQAPKIWFWRTSERCCFGSGWFSAKVEDKRGKNIDVLNLTRNSGKYSRQFNKETHHCVLKLSSLITAEVWRWRWRPENVQEKKEGRLCWLVQ